MEKTMIPWQDDQTISDLFKEALERGFFLGFQAADHAVAPDLESADFFAVRDEIIATYLASTDVEN